VNGLLFPLALELLGTLAWLTVVALQGRRLLHLLQLEEYELPRFWRWLLREPERAVPRAYRYGVLALIVVALAAVVRAEFALLANLVALVAAVVIWRRRAPLAAKKPLVHTPKALLLETIEIGLLALTAAFGVGCWVFAAVARTPTAPLFPLSLALVAVLPAVYLSLATLALYPVQVAAKRAIGELATLRLRRRRDLIVIGITGSYGKTSTKEILATLLAERYRVCKTAASVNTPVGVARTVLRELKADDHVFVVEMGAYVPGNIRDLARMARPRVGVLTAIGEQHLERFGSVERIAATKYELIQALPPDGLAVFNVDNPGCRTLAAATRHVALRTYGLETNGVPDVTATDITTGPDGTAFTVRAAGHGDARFTTALLGRHNVLNVLGATAVGLELGLSLQELAAAATRLEPVAHRLQLIRGTGGVTVIDDAYNSNPAGARAALAVMAEFPGRKVLVTPGMVELGALEDERHAEFGRDAAAVCDSIILVGRRRTAAIAAGALAAGFSSERLFVVPSLKEATAQLGRLVARGDVVLFENDLPDQYSDES
jgi:UDP-N-acetylmuramoyl-tripeptide--D-alanyl-D-alanine ligase